MQEPVIDRFLHETFHAGTFHAGTLHTQINTHKQKHLIDALANIDLRQHRLIYTYGNFPFVWVPDVGCGVHACAVQQNKNYSAIHVCSSIVKITFY